MRYKILTAYNGSNYSGWQIQETKNPPPTIQGELEKSLLKLAGEKIRVIGSGRTDAGVHAFGQTAHFDSFSDKLAKLPNLQKTLNAILPEDIRIIDIKECEPDFHAQHDARNKTYLYQLWTEQRFIPPHISPFAWACGSLNIGILHEGALLFKGQKDFASFQNAGSHPKTTIRTVFDIKIQESRHLDFYPDHSPIIQIFITADGFLKQMVRNIIGFLVGAAKEKISLLSLEAILSAHDRRMLPTFTAPARGLILVRVNY